MFDAVIRHVNGGDVLDLGCGEAGLYWALGYVEKAKSLSFYDINEEHLQTLSAQVESISPEYLENHFSETIDYLRENAFISPETNIENIAVKLIESVSDISKFNFQNSNSSQKFDTILCIESLQVTDNQEDLNNLIFNISKLLKDNGEILGISWRYNNFNEHTQHLVSLNYDGLLNPDENNFGMAFKNAGLTIHILQTVKTPDVNNYSEAIIFKVKKELVI